MTLILPITLPPTGDTKNSRIRTQLFDIQNYLNSGAIGIVGTITNDSAAAGDIGEYVESVIQSASAVSAVTDQQFFNVTSILLTAGDWNVYGAVIFTLNAATYRAVGSQAAISVNSANTTTDHILGKNVVPWGTNPTAGFDQYGSVFYRLSLSTTTTVYLKAWTGYSAGTPKAYGTIFARRGR